MYIGEWYRDDGSATATWPALKINENSIEDVRAYLSREYEMVALLTHNPISNWANFSLKTYYTVTINKKATKNKPETTITKTLSATVRLIVYCPSTDL